MIPSHDANTIDSYPVQQVLSAQNYMSGHGSAEEEEEGALALVDKMLLAMQHRQNALKIRCFSSLILF